MGGARCTSGGERNTCSVCLGNVKETDHLEGSGVDGRVVLKWTFKK
jgi:hypothetical protein